MPLHPRTPVLVGGGQVRQRAEDPMQAREPLDLMQIALERAAEDAGAPSLLAAADSIRVPKGIWEYSNPAALLAERFESGPVQTGIGPISGSTCGRMIADAARGIEAGERDVVLIGGAECEHSKRRAQKLGGEAPRTIQTGSQADEKFEDSGMSFERAEFAAGLRSPIHAFALADNRIRYDRGETLELGRFLTEGERERFAGVLINALAKNR